MAVQPVLRTGRAVGQRGRLRVELSLDLTTTTALGPVQRARALERLADRLVEGVLTVTASEPRSHVIVRLEEREGGTAVVVEDDGIGISAGTTSEAGHLGLRGMQERAILMGGRLEFGPRPGGGTYVEFWLPSSPS